MNDPRFRVRYRVLGFILLAVWGLTAAFILPPLSAQPVDNPREIRSTIERGIELYNAEQFDRAIEVWQQAAAELTLQEDPLILALVLSDLSAAYQELGQWQEAEATVTQSLNLLDNLGDSHSPLYADILAKALNHRGSLEWETGQLDRALTTWQQATVAYAQAENRTGVIGSLIDRAKALQGLGLSRRAYETLEGVRQQLDRESDPEIQATGWRELGQALRRMGRLEESEGALAKSWQLARDESAPFAARLELGNTQRYAADRAFARGDEAEAQAQRRSAIASYQQAAGSAESKVRIPAQLNLLSLWSETGKTADAVDLGRTLVRSLSSLPTSRSTIDARINLAGSLMNLGDASSMEDAAQLLATAVDRARQLRDRRTESYALGQLGKLYEERQQLPEARALTEKALLIAQEMQAPEIGYLWEWQLGRLSKQQGDREGAIAAYRSAVASLQSVRSDLLAIDADVQFRFRDRIESVYREFVDLLLPPQSAEVSQERLETAIETVDALQLAQLENFLGCDLSSTVAQHPALDRIDPHAALIYPILLDDRIDVIFRLPGQPLGHHSTPVDRRTVESTLKTLRRAIVRGNAGLAIETASAVYEWTIAPLEADLETHPQVKTLVFVLDSELRNLPIAALYDAKTDEYLIEKQYALVLLPSTQAFDLSTSAKDVRVLAAGISEKLHVADREFSALNVTQELATLQNTISSKILLNAAFTQPNIQQNLNSDDFSILHLATHGNFSSDPDRTYLLVYGAQSSTGELLRARDLDLLLRTRSSPASHLLDLLVLSACQTAAGDNRATLGLAGLAIRAGAKSALATLWQVSDESTVKLMERFYQELNTPGTTKAEALHRAQKELLADLNYQAPYYWASYVLVGNWR